MTSFKPLLLGAASLLLGGAHSESSAGTLFGQMGSASPVWVKASVNVEPLHPRMYEVPYAALEAHRECQAGVRPVVTAAAAFRHLDEHSPNSLHYVRDPGARAMDLRTRHLRGGYRTALCIVNKLRIRLGSDFLVILERDHIHVQLSTNRSV